MHLVHRIRTLALGFALLTLSCPLLADTRIVTSLKPLTLLVRAIATDDMQISTLVPAGASPHNYAMKPSQRRALENADVIFWVGPEMETFLARLLTGEEFHDRSVAFMSAPGDAHGTEHNSASDEPDGGHTGHGDHHHDGEDDPHLWLDPALAIDMAETIRDVLATMDGADPHALDRNLEAFRNSLATTEQSIRHQFEPVREVSLFAYHNALVRFAEHYNLTLSGVLTLNPELSPGARHIAEVQARLRSSARPCLLTEPQFNRQWWRSITEGLDITFSTWDPLATDIEVTANGYANFQQAIADAVLKCLPEKAEH